MLRGAVKKIRGLYKNNVVRTAAGTLYSESTSTLTSGSFDSTPTAL